MYVETLGKICAVLRMNLGTRRTFGMESFLAITYLRDSESTLAFVNASDYSASWDFADANHARSLLTLTQKCNGNIKKLRYLAARDDIDLWFEDECHFQQHGFRCTMWIPPDYNKMKYSLISLFFI